VTSGVPGTADLEPEWARALKVLRGAPEICLACHIRPDADALGSMLAVASALRARGPAVPKVIASFGDDPFTVPAGLRFLPGAGALTPPARVPRRPAVMVTFDAASPDRLGSLTGPAEAADELIVLDHHASNDGFGTVALVDPAAAATAVLARELIARLGVPLSADIALGLYAGLVTDTGSFKFATTGATHRLAAELIDTGIDPDEVARALFDRAPFAYLELLAAVARRAVLEPAAARGLGLVWTTVTRADRAVAGLPLEVVEPVIDVLRRSQEAEVAVVLKESDRGDWLVSARSKSAVDVGRACVALGGGGHARAAGFTARGPAAEVMAGLREQLARPDTQP
jgi:bifunctional oligoribonuclease and PAP phosphatase NrnA